MAQAVYSEERNPHSDDRTEYRLYFIALYPLFFAAACLGRLLPKQRAAKSRGSVFQEAAGLAHSVIPWVFSGR